MSANLNQNWKRGNIEIRLDIGVPNGASADDWQAIGDVIKAIENLLDRLLPVSARADDDDFADRKDPLR